MSRTAIVLLWCAALTVAASLLVAVDIRTRDPDSTLYTKLASALADRPVSRWIAPEWGGAWDQHGLFREHPVGILIPSVLAIRAGFPREQAPYAVNMLYQAAVIVLIPLVAGALVRRAEAHALASVLQLLPIAFVYRIRGNQEHPLLMCFLALIYGAHLARSTRAWIGMPLMIAALCFLVLVKGAFAMFAIVAAALWLLIVPAPEGTNHRGWLGLAIAVASAGDGDRLRSGVRADDGGVVSAVLSIDAAGRVDEPSRSARHPARRRQRRVVPGSARMVRRSVESRRGGSGLGLDAIDAELVDDWRRRRQVRADDSPRACLVAARHRRVRRRAQPRQRPGRALHLSDLLHHRRRRVRHRRPLQRARPRVRRIRRPSPLAADRGLVCDFAPHPCKPSREGLVACPR
jgi:hypothetical protein